MAHLHWASTSMLQIMEVANGGSKIFPRLGANSQGGRQHKILTNFPKNCMKLKEFERGRGAHPKFYHVDPPLDATHSWNKSLGILSEHRAEFSSSHKIRGLDIKTRIIFYRFRTNKLRAGQLNTVYLVSHFCR